MKRFAFLLALVVCLLALSVPPAGACGISGAVYAPSVVTAATFIQPATIVAPSLATIAVPAVVAAPSVTTLAVPSYSAAAFSGVGYNAAAFNGVGYGAGYGGVGFGASSFVVRQRAFAVGGFHGGFAPSVRVNVGAGGSGRIGARIGVRQTVVRQRTVIRRR